MVVYRSCAVIAPPAATTPTTHSHPDSAVLPVQSNVRAGCHRDCVMPTHGPLPANPGRQQAASGTSDPLLSAVALTVFYYVCHVGGLCETARTMQPSTNALVLDDVYVDLVSDAYVWRDRPYQSLEHLFADVPDLATTLIVIAPCPCVDGETIAAALASSRDAGAASVELNVHNDAETAVCARYCR